MSRPGPAVTRIVLVRHGEARCNVDRVVGGPRGCSGLSELGIRQGEALRDRLAATAELAGAAALYSSVLPRARETAEIIAPAFGDLPVTEDCDLCELHPGECDGMTWAEFEECYGAPQDDPDRPLSPGGESLAVFLERIARVLRYLVAAHEGETVVAACHGGIVFGSLIRLLDLPLVGRPVSFEPTNAAITEWLRVGGRWRLVRYNDAAHLVGVPAGSAPA